MSQQPSTLDADALNALRGNFAEWLGLEITEADADHVVGTWTVDPRLHQPYGIVHGGAHCSAVETLASMGAAIWLFERDSSAKVVGVSNSTDFYRAVTDGVLTSRATPVHRGRSQQVWLVETTDDQGRNVARGQVRLQNLYPQG